MPSRSSCTARLSCVGQPVVAQPQVDEARPGDFRRLAEVVQFAPATICAAISRGGLPSSLPSGIAKLA